MNTHKRKPRIRDKDWWWGELTPGKTAPTIRGFIVLFWGIAMPLYVLTLTLFG